MKTIGFTGLGVMGKSMARNLMKQGWEVHGYARHPEKIQDLIAEGLIQENSLKDLAEKSDILITMVGTPDDVREVWLSEDGLMNHANPGTIGIDMTTSDPQLSNELYKLGKEKGIAMMDAPVTGGDAGARNGTLTILGGGDKETWDELLPMFEAMGTNLKYQGEAGSGQSAKLVNQILIAGAMAGVAEAFAYAQKLNLDPALLYDSLHEGAAASKSMDLYWPRMEKGDFQPGFYIRHFIKDMKLAQKEADKAGLELPALDLVLKEYESLNEDDLGTQALLHYYTKDED